MYYCRFNNFYQVWNDRISLPKNQHAFPRHNLFYLCCSINNLLKSLRVLWVLRSLLFIAFRFCKDYCCLFLLFKWGKVWMYSRDRMALIVLLHLYIRTQYLVWLLDKSFTITDISLAIAHKTHLSQTQLKTD